MMEVMPVASQPIYQFYAELKDYKPLIWRRFQVAGSITLAQLGYVTMTLFEMKGSHLFHLEYSVNENILISPLSPTFGKSHSPSGKAA